MGGQIVVSAGENLAQTESSTNGSIEIRTNKALSGHHPQGMN